MVHGARPAFPLKSRTISVAATLVVGVLALVVAGCGATTTVLGGGSQQSTPTATATGGGGPNPIKGTTVRPCGGPSASAADTANGAVVLTERAASGDVVAGGPAPTDVHVGAVIQIRLAATARWTLSGATGPVDKLDPQSGQDSQLNVCFWNFKATAPGDATISFTGTALCEGGGPCPQWARDESFAIHVA